MRVPTVGSRLGGPDRPANPSRDAQTTVDGQRHAACALGIRRVSARRGDRSVRRRASAGRGCGQRASERDARAASTAMTGAPTTTPRAYAPINQPARAVAACGSDAKRLPSRPCEISGSSPIETNSEAPTPKPPSASDASAVIVRARPNGAWCWPTSPVRPASSARPTSPAATDVTSTRCLIVVFMQLVHPFLNSVVLVLSQ